MAQTPMPTTMLCDCGMIFSVHTAYVICEQPLITNAQPKFSKIILLRSRPVDPNVVCSSVRQSVGMLKWHDDGMTEWWDVMMMGWQDDRMTGWLNDWMTRWQDEEKLHRRLTIWYILLLYILFLFTFTSKYFKIQSVPCLQRMTINLS